jgi:ribosomal peptide maturation radical SAM protein 1
MASAALARLIREQAPDIQIVFGGYAVEGPPGRQVLRAFPFVDAIAEGDGEPIIGALVRSSVGEEGLDDVPGVMTRRNRGVSPRQRYELEKSPTPDYDDWFSDLEQLKLRDRVTVVTTLLPVESSRGCWWGQKHHCVFCGIDENTLSYRQKKPETVLAQLAELRARHGADTPFRFSDYILPQNYMRTLLPLLAQVKPPYELQCEIKANQSEDRMQAFAAAGFTELQPGIESFSTDVLNLMKKGVRGIQNVKTLKLAYLNGVVLHYNLIWGIPGEKPEWYREMLAQLPRLYHLMPPVSRTEAIVTRYAPLHMQPERFCDDGSTPVHHRCYDALFSQDFLERTGFSLDDYAYYFERYFAYDPLGESLYKLLTKCVDHWKSLHRDRVVYLTWEQDDGRLRIRDSRFGDATTTLLDSQTSAVYLACDGAVRRSNAIVKQLGLTADEVRRALDKLDQLRLLWREGADVMGLAMPASVCRSRIASQWTRAWAAVYC